MNLEKLGFSNWFVENWNSDLSEEIKFARVTAVNRDNFLIRNESGELTAEVTGKLLYGVESKQDMPTVGDWVMVNYFDDGSLGIIHDVLPRKSLLKRKASGKTVDFQLIAANIDTAFIMQSLDQNYNLRRFERYMVMAADGNIDPALLLSKSDLKTTEELESVVFEVKNRFENVTVFAFSSETGVGLEEIVKYIQPTKTYCLLGSSGVGKTTLLNKLLKDEEFAINEVRESDHRGRHTTTRRQLILLDSGGMMIDSPGMRELGNFAIDSGIDETFSEIIELAENCRFSDCTHVNEPGCAVLEAIEKGVLEEDRYNNFIRMKKESDHYERSYLEKKQRDKEFGKMVKEYKNLKKKKKI